MAATDITRLLRGIARVLLRPVNALLGLLGGLLGGLVTSGPAQALSLPEDKAEALVHVYDGGGVRASGPALLVRKSLADKVSLTGSWYVDAVSNASIDVLSSASPFRETRNAVDLGADWLVRDALITLGFSHSSEPDYKASSVSLDVAQEVFGGMTTVNLGFSRGSDKVGKTNAPEFDERARHWLLRLGASQVMSPRWMATANLELVSDAGFLGSPYRQARLLGATVAENLPRTRTGRALKLRSIHDTDAWLPRSALRAEYRYYWDTWDLKGHTLEFGASRYLGDPLMLDTFLRHHRQTKALFYSDNAQASTTYLTRNRQLGSFSDVGLGARLAYTAPKGGSGFQFKFTGSYELKHFNFSDFTDRSGNAYRHKAHVLQLLLTATH